MLNMKAMILLVTGMFLFRITQAADGQYWYNCSCENSDAKVFENLFNEGCCSDRVECPSKPKDKPENEKERPKYLGVDVFMKVWRTSVEPYLLIVHQQNFLITSVFESTLKIREIHTGNLKLSGSTFTKSFMQYCRQHQNDDYSSIVTGFSVQVGAEKKTYIVCEDQVLIGGYQQYKNDEGLSFDGQSRTYACNQIHPAFCNTTDGPLISIAVIPTKKNDENPYIYGYYAEKRQTEDREKREYRVNAWRWNNKDKSPVKTDKFYGYLAEIDTFDETDTNMLGLYFTVDGNACFFKREFSDPPKVDIEDLEVPRKPCLSFQAFIGCPTPWCFDIKIDASFSYTETNSEGGNDFKVVVFKGFFYWILKDIGLPFEVPSYKNAYKIFNKPEGWNNYGICHDYTGYEDVPVCLPPSVDAAFCADVSGQQLIYIRDSDRKESTINAFGTKKDIKMTKIDPITGEDKPNIQAALFDQDSKTAYLFYPNDYNPNYKAYKYISKDNWEHVPDKSGNLQDLNIEFTSVDAGVNLRNNKAYIFSNNLYYEVTFAEGKLQVVGNQSVGIDQFFDVRKECYYNSQDEYFALLSRYKDRNITAENQMGKVTARPEVQEVTKKVKQTAVYIILIVLCGVGIVCAAWVAMFFYDRQAKSVQVSKRGKVEKTGKTDSMKTGKTKSKAETKSKSESKSKVQ